MSDEVWKAIIGGVVAIAMALIAKMFNGKLNTIHTLVNSNLGTSLRVGALALRREADRTNDAKDIEAALLAERLYSEHEAKQAIVDKEK